MRTLFTSFGNQTEIELCFNVFIQGTLPESLAFCPKYHTISVAPSSYTFAFECISVIKSSHEYISFQAIVAGSGPGAGLSHFGGSSGAGHGGRGGRGKSQSLTGAFYGDFIRPQAFGSSGGGGSGNSIATGGGVIHITAQQMLHDGQITVNGKDALTNSDYGGGSGGSVLIEAGSFDGSGVIQANGGAGGGTDGGGGSGGRIAIHFNSTFFSGIISAYGGASTIETGAAGTIYKKDESKDYSALEVFNQGRKPSQETIDDYYDLTSDSARTWLTLSHDIVGSPEPAAVQDIDVGPIIYKGLTIDEVKLGGSVHLAIEPDSSLTRLHTFRQFYGTYEGDSFGFLHVGPRQLVTIPNTDYYIPVNLRVYQSGYIQLPERVMLYKNSLSLNAGYLIGVKDLTISQCTVMFGSGSGAFITGSLQATNFKFQTVTIMSQGLLDMVATNTNYSLEMDSLVINSGGVLNGRYVVIVAQTVTVDESGLINLDARGESCPATDVYYAGSGGSHAGYGGFGFLGESSGGKRKDPFGSVFRPAAFGKAGYAGRSSSSCTSGFGGGILNLTISGTLQLDGEITSR